MNHSIKIKAFDEDDNYLGLFTISCNDREEDSSQKEELDNISLENIPIIEDIDNTSPILYSKIAINNVNIFLLEATQYQVSFEPNEKDLEGFSLFKYENSPLTFMNVAGFYGGFLNFTNYVGKTFFDIEKDGKTIYKLPIEVRSKKIKYNEQYPAMIGDLSKYSSGLIFEINSPLYQSFELNENRSDTSYEDFMLLEYLFRPENLPSTFEYLSKNLYTLLENQIEEVPTSMASNVGPNELIDVFSNPKNLYKTNDDNSIWNQRTNGYIPIRINETKHVDTIDVPENRFYKNFLEFIESLIISLINKTEEGYVRDKLYEYKEEISYYLSQRYFKDISIMDYAPLNSQVLQKKEGYRDILEYYLMFEFGFKMNWSDITNDFRGYEKKLSTLYEYWCYFELIHIVKELTGSKINFEDVFEIDKQNWNIHLKEGIIKELDFEIDNQLIKINLMYNKTFNKDKGTYSVEMRPDYTLEFIINNNSYKIHFDAKYRLNIYDESFKNQDIIKMHSYKDAIENTLGAYVLYPGEKKEIFEENELESVGAFPLNPGDDKNEKRILVKFIDNLLEKLLYIY